MVANSREKNHMRSARLRQFMVVLLSGGFLLGSVSCIPSRDQLNGTIASGVLNGIELVLTLGVQSLVDSVVGSSST
jgi:hypothetical protein